MGLSVWIGGERGSSAGEVSASHCKVENIWGGDEEPEQNLYVAAVYIIYSQSSK